MGKHGALARFSCLPQPSDIYWLNYMQNMSVQKHSFIFQYNKSLFLFICCICVYSEIETDRQREMQVHMYHFWCLCVCWCVCVYTRTGAHMPWCMDGVQRTTLQTQIFSSPCQEFSFSWHPLVSRSSGLWTSRQFSSLCLAHHQNAKITDVHHHTWFCCVSSGDCTWAPNVFYWLSHLIILHIN